MLKKSQKPIQVKWVFKKKNKQDGLICYKGRIVVKGFVQIPGIGFTHTYSPVATKTLIRILLSIVLWKDKEGWVKEMIDIEAGFLEADLDKDIYNKVPKGLIELGYYKEEELEGKCIKLGKAIYGCMQSPQAFFKTLCLHLKKVDMKQSKVDPCIWY